MTAAHSPRKRSFLFYGLLAMTALLLWSQWRSAPDIGPT